MAVTRFLVAARDIDAGETICFERPLVIGPKQATAAVCLSCYRRVDGAYRCPDCAWPLCDAECRAGDDHRVECAFFRSRGFRVDVDVDQVPNPTQPNPTKPNLT